MRTTSIMNSYSTVRKYEYLYSVTLRTKWRELNGQAISLGYLDKRRLSWSEIPANPGGDALASDGRPVGPEFGEAVAEAGRGHAV